jgi:ABC-type glycerol-3-phosphate transport system substrate-binding protein
VKSTFQLVTLAVFVVFILLAAGILITLKGQSSGDKAIDLTIWGSVAEPIMSSVINSVVDKKKFNVQYSQIGRNSFDQTFLEAIASGRGPDLFILPQDSIYRYTDRVYPLPYENMSERVFRDSYIDGANIYLSPRGIIALPFSVDPLVMYWNRSLFNDAGIAVKPRYWDEFFPLADKFNKIDSEGRIRQSLAALGEFFNVKNSKEIISALIMQSGNQIAALSGDRPVNFLANASRPVSAVNFYAEFANPRKAAYSWNRSLPDSLSAFTTGRLAIYFGFGSELNYIKAKNPNLDFDLSYFPQLRAGSVKLTFGNMLGLAVSKQSANLAADFEVALLLSGRGGVKAWNKQTGLPPVRRDLLAVKPPDAYSAIFYDSALWSRAWLDPNSQKTNQIFQTMVESVTSGRSDGNAAVARAADQLSALF